MAVQERRTTKAPHPLLKLGRWTQEVYQHIKLTDGVTVKEIADTLNRPYNTVKEAVRLLKNEGLVIVTGSKTSPDSSNSQDTLRAVREHESARPRDQLEIEYMILVNDYGEYSVFARIVGESPLSKEGSPKAYHAGRFKTRVPRPAETFKTRQMFHTEPAKREPLTIDGEIVDSQTNHKSLAITHEVRGVRPEEDRG